MGNPIALPEIFKQGFQDFVTPEYVTAPFTQIQNRAQVSNSLKAIAGIERVQFRGLSPLDNEFGPNGQVVQEIDTKDARVRFVGNWTARSNNYGFYAISTANGDFVEITFYGTGLDILFSYLNNFASLDVRTTIDGGVESGDIITASYSNVLGSRNYTPNITISVASGLTLGWHTVKLRNNSTAEFDVQGMQVINSRTDLAVLSGKGIAQGSSQGLAALTTSAFDSGVVGTRGARVVKYIKDGQIGSAVQEVDSVAQYLGSADHTNEEVVRRIDFREFGANRGDDFSTLAGVASVRAFTLDDGTTTLTCNAMRVSGDDLVFDSAASYLTLTFVGTGLDVVFTLNDGYSTSHPITIDGGASIGTWIRNGRFKICSGLPYGTHTVKFSATVAAQAFSDFIIYQPKKPSIPDGAFEIADYCVLTDFVANTDVSINNQRDAGVLLKASSREAVFVGTSTINIDANYPSGQDQRLTVNASYVQYSFFGTGFTYRYVSNTTYDPNSTVLLNSVALTTANFPTASAASYTGSTFNFATGALSQATSNATYSGFRITGLPLGFYTLRMTRTSANFAVGDLSVITPIHINESSLKVGSQSLRSNQNYDVVKLQEKLGPDLRKAKAWVIYDTTATKIIDSYNVAAIVSPSTGSGYIHFEKPFKRDDYVAVGSANGGTSKIVSFTTKRANSILFSNTADTGTPENNIVSCLFFGELIDE